MCTALLGLVAPCQAPIVLDGAVLGPLAEPLPNAAVFVAQDERGAQIVARGRSDASGEFRIPRVSADAALWVFAAVDGLTTSRQWLRVLPGPVVEPLQLRLYEARVVRGRIVGPDDAPIAGACVLGTRDAPSVAGGLRPAECRSDDAGRFELRGMPIGLCVLRVFAPGFALRQYWLSSAHDEEVTLRLDRRSDVQLGVRVEGLPADVVGAARVRLCAISGGVLEMPSVLAVHELDAGGALTVGGLVAAQWEVTIAAPGFVFEPPRVLTPGAGERHEATFRARPAVPRELRGTLVDPTGRPLARRSVVCEDARRTGAHAPLAVATTDAAGGWSMRVPDQAGEPWQLALHDARWVLDQASGRGLIAVATKWLVMPGEAADVGLVAAPAAEVVARLVDGDGRALARTPACIERYSVRWRRWARIATAVSDADGVARFAGLPGSDADARVRVGALNACGTSAAFALTPASHETVVPCAPPCRVGGRLLDAAGQPMAGAVLWLRADEFDVGLGPVATDRAGRFVFVGVPAGEPRIELWRGRAFEVVRERLAVAAPGPADIELRLPR